MKKIVIIAMALVMSANVFSQGIEFDHGTFNEALVKAKKENKLIFMDCYTTWCGPCKYLSKNIFTQKEVGDFYNKNFVNLKMDCEKGEGPALATKFGVNSYPSLLFIDANGNAIHKLVGGMPAEDLIKGGKAALNPAMRIGTLKAKYEEGNRELEFLMTYLGALKAQYDRVNMPIVAKEIIKQTSLEKYMNKEQFYVISSANFPYGSEEFNYLLENKDKVKEMLEPYDYQSLFLSNFYKHLGQYAAECKDLKDLNAEIDKCNKQLAFDDLEGIKKRFSYVYYIVNNQQQKWYDLKIEDAEALKGTDGYVYFYNGICDEILRTPKLVESKDIVDQFLKVAQEIATDEKNGLIMGNFMLAKLFLHKKEKEKALKSFTIFLDNNRKAGGNTTHPSITNLKVAIDNL